jgi:predicted dehydrogenase
MTDIRYKARENGMYRIAVIGAGQLGSRHLQGLAKMTLPITLSVVDPSLASLEVARERFSQIPHSGEVKHVDYLTSLNDLKEDLDFVILATTADVRAEITRNLLSKFRVQNILFEKIVFQIERDFDEISALLDAHKVKAWVNCARRIYPFYRDMKTLFRRNDKICFHLHGGDWGLACNAIHFMDLIAFLTSNYDVQLDTNDLDKGIVESKRKGFIELTGTLHGRHSNGNEFTMHSRRDSAAPHIMTILGSSVELVIDEGRGIAFIAKKDNSWAWEEVKFGVPYQSDLTNSLTADILQDGTCGLPTLEESSLLHKPLLRAVLKHIQTNLGTSLKACPVT